MSRYLIFRLDDEQIIFTTFGLPIAQVSEVLGINMTILATPLKRIPLLPSFIRGTINLRKTPVPLIDLRRKFGMKERKDTEKTCIIIARPTGSKKDFGLVVDKSDDVEDIPDSSLIPAAPETKKVYGVPSDFIASTGTLANGASFVLLDLDKILADIGDLLGV